jgi:hypothetical protein
LTSDSNASNLDHMSDGDRRTVWATPAPQRGNEQIVADLGSEHDVNGVVLALGPWTWAFPRVIVVASSTDGVEWTQAWRGETAAHSLAAAIDDPLDVRVPFAFGQRRARYVRISQTGESSDEWAVAELSVWGR